MNVEIGIEAAQFPRTEYITGILVAVWPPMSYSDEDNRQVINTMVNFL
jgi:hypothetical protein